MEVKEIGNKYIKGFVDYSVHIVFTKGDHEKLQEL